MSITFSHKEPQKLTHKQRVLLAQQLYDYIVNHDTWKLNITREHETIWLDPNTPFTRQCGSLRIEFQVNLGGASGPTPYVSGEPQAG